MKEQRLASGVGIALVDLDLGNELSDADVERLRDHWRTHHLLVVKEQRLEPADQVRCMGYLGMVVDEAGDGLAYRISTNTRSDGSGLAELLWHADYCSTPYPLAGISLYANEVSGAVSGTGFVSGVKGYARLDATRRHHLDSLKVVNVVTSSGSPLDPATFEETWNRLEDSTEDRVVSRLPAVIEHPTTGERILNVCRMFTLGFEGMSYGDGRALLDELFSVLYAAEGVYDHQWESGDLVMWDNIVMQHRRGAVPSPRNSNGGVRTMTRVIVSDTYAELRQYLPGIDFSAGRYPGPDLPQPSRS